MITTVVRFPEEEYRLYKELAAKKGWSLAEFFRVAARKVAGVKPKSKKYSIWDLGTKIKFKGPKDGAKNFDRYYYDFLAKSKFSRK